MAASMKPIHKRFYTVLPRPAVVASSSSSSRVRSNSAPSSRSLYTATHLTFLDGPPPPPPSTRGNSNLIIGSRLAAEARGEVEGHTNHPSNQGQSSHLPYSIALTLGQSDASSHLPLSPYNPILPYQSLSPLFVCSAKSADTPAPDHRKKRQRTRYQLDVGAYGIPKRSRGHCVAGRDGHGRMYAPGEARSEAHQEDLLGRAVQVGEDAYFVRDNAMGVADGVGGWSRIRRTANPTDPSPSALFARRLMHFCSEEVDAACEQQEQSFNGLDAYSDAEDDIFAELEDSLEELEEGLDVLMILEKAYEKTLRSHVRPADHSAASSRSRSPSPLDSLPESAAASHAQASASRSDRPRIPEGQPLFEGSSTALVAILEHPSPRSIKSYNDGTKLFDPQPIPSRSPRDHPGAVIRIAHLGDCMGMLVRGDAIVWRTEEMWWTFNTPVQLGPASSTKPTDARVFTVPVEADDILILASDGLSDNLWDAEILDEVVRFRRSFMSTPSADGEADGKPAPVNSQLRRSTLAGMLSEALCSRAKRVSETRGSRSKKARAAADNGNGLGGVQVDVEVPFARRAREQGRLFDGGKPDELYIATAAHARRPPSLLTSFSHDWMEPMLRRRSGEVHHIVLHGCSSALVRVEDTRGQERDRIVDPRGRVEPVPAARVLPPLDLRPERAQRVPQRPAVLHEHERVVHAVLEQHRRPLQDPRVSPGELAHVRVGACGKTQRKEGSAAGSARPCESGVSAIVREKCRASSPRPWRKTTVWVCGAVGSMVRMGSSMVVVVVVVLVVRKRALESSLESSLIALEY
ncbi:hypothetical protein FKP32DRAFT_1688401 [Trametes sanguinea]|nr:hypothetical protein FKP32DRAFT_1688401 [Trametes sanguinea]